MAVSKWMFTKEQILNTPSRKHGIDSDKELSYRHQAANLIQDMGQRLSVTQLCINTAIVYMHRFYMFQSFGRFPRNEMAPACLFLAAKVEEEPRKLEHVIRVAHACLRRDNTPAPDPNTEAYLEQAQLVVVNENILLQTLGFEISIEHPHTHVVKTCSLVRASKDLAQTSYFLATNSLHLTTFCLQYRHTIVACVCIYLACKWSNWKIPKSNEGKEWYYYVDRGATQELLEDLVTEFLNILDKCPNKLKKKIMGWKAGHREQLYQSEEEKAAQDSRKQKSEPSASATSSDPARTSANISSSQHRHTNHDRKHVHSEKKEHGERREESEQKDHSERREAPAHMERRDIGPTGDGLPIKKEPHVERRDFLERREDRKDINDRRNTEIKSGYERKDIEKKESFESRLKEKKETIERKDLEGKTALSKLDKRDGDRKDALERKESDRQKAEFHERKDVQGAEKRDEIDSKRLVSEKKDHNLVNTDVSRTNLLSLSIKSEVQPQTQHSAKSEFLDPKSEKIEKLSQDKEPKADLVTSNPTPNIVPVSVSRNTGTENIKPGMHKSKSESVLNYKDYLQRKEKERQQLMLLQKQGNSNLNKTFTEGSNIHVNKPVNLDTSLPVKIQGYLPKVKEETEHKVKPEIDMIPVHESDGKRRIDAEPKNLDEKEVHVKRRNRSNSKSPGASKKSPRVHSSNSVKISPVKAHTEPSARNLHLKIQKSENPPLKLQITNNSGQTPLSPVLKSPVKNLKEIPKSEPFVDLGEPLKLNLKQEPTSESEMDSSKSEIPIPKINIKQEPDHSNDIDDTGIELKPEHSGMQPLKLHIKELPDAVHDIAGAKSESPIPSLKISIKKEPGSGGNTPIKYKTEHSDSNTPLKYTIKQEPSNSGSPHEPLKMKLKASGSGYHTSEKYHRHDPNRPEGHHEHSGKHRHKGHKSHKHRDKDRERKSSKHSVEVPGTNGKPELKIRVKLPTANSSSCGEASSHRSSKHDRHHKIREGANVLPEIVGLNKNTNSEEHERHQPWSMAELLPKSSSKITDSPSRKRRRTPTVDEGSGPLTQPQQKAAKTNSHRLRRSSSSHSVVSMEMSDSECGEEAVGAQNKSNNEDQLKSLHKKLQQAIQYQQKVIDTQLKQQHSGGYSDQKSFHQGYERQKSGFDLDLYCGNASVPPMPQGQPPLPPTPPPSQADSTPPPPPPH